MYEKDVAHNLAAACGLGVPATLSVVPADPSVLGFDTVTFTFTTPSAADLVIIQIPSTPYYSLITETISLGLITYLYAEPVQ